VTGPLQINRVMATLLTGLQITIRIPVVVGSAGPYRVDIWRMCNRTQPS
jgi:hypothetical protein